VDLRQFVSGCCTELIFNHDELGVSGWEDPVRPEAMVSVSMSCQIIRHGVDRNLKHRSLICCVLAVRQSMTLFMVSLQVHDSILESPKSERPGIGGDFMLESIYEPYLSGALFQQSKTTALIHWIDNPLENEEFAGT
jgi:hypothetical protein